MLIVGGNDGRSVGATAFFTALSLEWPGKSAMCELDPRGASTPYRVKSPAGEFMPGRPSVASLALATRPGGAAVELERFLQPSLLGISMIRSEADPRAFAEVSGLLPGLASVCAAWGGTVIADLGQLLRSNPAMITVRSATVVLLVIRATPEGLGHLRARAEQLSQDIAQLGSAQTHLGVVVAGNGRDDGNAVTQTELLLRNLRVPIPVLGLVRHDPTTAAALEDGQRPKKFGRSAMSKSAQEVIAEMWRLWPQQMAAVQWRPAAATVFQQRRASA